MDKEYNIKNLINIVPILLFILIKEPLYIFTLLIFYIAISIIYKVKIKPIPNITMFFSILLIQLITPYGEVLFEVGNIYITKGALFRGIKKASLFVGMIHLSRNLNLEPVNLRGKLGSLISDTFYYLTQLTTGDSVRPKNLIDDLDKKLLNLKNVKNSSTKENRSNKSTKGYLFLVITIIIFTIDNINFKP